MSNVSDAAGIDARRIRRRRMKSAMFKTRSLKLERIDTGDYTSAEYDRFLEDIRLVNRFAGDTRAIRNSLMREIEGLPEQTLSVLDVGAGSGELLRSIAASGKHRSTPLRLVGLELNARSAESILEESTGISEISSVRGNALSLPFADNSFDFVISSLFAHHFDDDRIVAILREMSRVARRRVIVIDLHRHPGAYAAYKIFCAAFRISRLVREDGSLSILRGFLPDELSRLAQLAGFRDFGVTRSAPFRLVLTGKTSDGDRF